MLSNWPANPIKISNVPKKVLDRVFWDFILSVCHLEEGVFLYLMKNAHVAQSVEHVLGKDEVTGSIPVVG